MNSNQPTEPTSTPANRSALRRSGWLVVIMILVVPAILAFIGAAIKLDSLAVASPLIGGGIGGIYCGQLFARRFGKTAGVKILLGLVVGCVAASTIVGIGFGGCMLGGFTVRSG